MTPRLSGNERAYVLEVLDSEFRASKSGRMTSRLEEKFAEMFASRFAISFTNGTATLHAALAAGGVGPGDEVIVPPLTMSSTAFAVVQAGAVPVFADVHPETWTIDPSSITQRLTPRTKAIMPVALFGLAADLDPIMALAGQHALTVVDDDAQCFLGYYKGRIVGSIGHASSFSFQSSKHMTAGEGGIVTTNDEALATRIRRLTSLGYASLDAAKGKIAKTTIQDPGYERHASIGWNYRMPELCAAVALAQLERLPALVEMRRAVVERYREAASGCRWLVAQSVPDGYVHSWWTWAVKLETDGQVTWHAFRDKYRDFGGDGIYAAWQLTYLEPAFRNGEPLLNRALQVAGRRSHCERGLCPIAEALQPLLLQFKTNYFDTASVDRQAEALRRTIEFFGR